jgi:hypothetical protein
MTVQPVTRKFKTRPTHLKPNRLWSTPAISGVLGIDFRQFGGAILATSSDDYPVMQGCVFPVVFP